MLNDAKLRAAQAREKPTSSLTLTSFTISRRQPVADSGA
jgi:hypothetical protein